MMQVNVQQRRPRGIDAASQRRLDQIDVVEPLRAMQVDDEMHAGATHAIARREMVYALIDSERPR